ncbi:tRNA (N6-isopentenyl adenosine(37)-C2)-methylthiotransferase MiaB [Sulfurovum sp.]|jgi:tRNA-2-methylthio-N6-dimethylallyladenosine synthase|uniref:tRNA (N6-isopentenyl adenosine(37)-C2)-methylthiotransferase MiaB n=1 Tax=Sulfurovum sp. TaxID=1969726 RepID=UPI002A360863|nr:tRNA (N6-isopentenyl adenosine(37)-C2)-methylthiotransferase MiaB [Sulfurovum sp.]MDD2450535.1 tRNA (N6-isopentenyl adenosine(37)-C2)-methylthiotransferase MiaB [Sulfurovum sp.]MDD3500370.1 tRNA (N6-isopentenyl adenosine(37)-C2)-methylthiotransferase MiaB [Sulfurovum sp.]MDY0403921.1 tRNA (N6-isopentenyl adenosine(37)-C2)-methylthiotransferase MiaB [Sulfurovum sp.]
MSQPKKLFIETLGCAMNVRDSEHMIAELNKEDSYQITENLEEADLIIINTCSVREKPVAKLFSEIGIFNKRKKEGAKIGVTGCTASHLGEEIIKRAPVVDFVLGARNVSKITKVLEKKHAVEIATDYDESTYAFGEYRSNPYKALVNISIGCDKKCTFCIVPATRGEEISIPSDLIVQEITKAVATGAKEVMLLGQNVNNYGRRFGGNEEKINFTQLLQKISGIEGLERIRFTSPHPLHMDDAFLEEFASNPKICKQIHVPLQSGSTRLLQSMKRGYTKENFLNRCAKIRALCPEATISTDIIVGFPGESDEDFEDTMDVLEKVQFEQVFSFKYSPRPHTEAQHFTDVVPDEVASERLSRLQARHFEMLAAQMDDQFGKVHKVYFDELKPNGRVSGRTDDGRLVFVEGSEELLGKIKDVKITKTSRASLDGEVINA